MTVLTHDLPLTVELGEQIGLGVRWASIKAGDVVVFSSPVVDTRERPAERAIASLFGEHLRRLLEDS